MSRTVSRRRLRQRLRNGAALPAAMLVVVTVLLLVAAPARATSVLERSPAALFEGAVRVVYGVVEGVDVGEDGQVFVTLRIERELGPDPSDAAEEGTAEEGTGDPVPSLRIDYGELATSAVVADLPRPEPGDRVLWALAGEDGGVSPVTGMWQGAWTVESAGLVDLRGRVLGLDDGIVRLGGRERESAAVLDAVADALAGGDVRLDDELPSAGIDGATAPAPLPPVPSSGDAGADTAEAEEAEDATPRELLLAVPESSGLRSSIREAEGIWREAGFDLTVRFDADAPDRVSVGEAAELGPDVAILLRRIEGRGGVDLLVRPGAAGRRADAWAQAIGRLLGLPPAAQGFASGLLPLEARVTPGSEDVADLARRVAARRGDLDGDGDVDLYDLAALAETFGSEGIALPADLDGSGRVDRADLERLREGYEFLPASRDPPPGSR